MIELNHSTLNAAPPPEPAKPMTADLLLNLEIQQHRRFAGCTQERQRVSTGCEILDELFDGGDATEGGSGMERGIVVGVSAEGREGEGILLSLNLLASVLIPHLSTPSKSTPIAQIIDTTGSFPLSLLAQVLKSRIISQLTTHNTLNQAAHQTSKPPKDEQTNALVQKALELISISRVFDIPGLWEVLREVNHPPTPPTPTPPAAGQSSADWPSTSESTGQMNVSLPASFILGKERPQKAGEEEGIQILIIHTITPLINDFLARKEKSEAHTLLTTLSTTIHTLSQNSNILTLLHNTTLPISTPQSDPSHQNQNQNSKKSLFPSLTQKPALGQIFTPFPSLHILISKLPKSRQDAELLYAEDTPTHQTSIYGHTNPRETTEKEVQYCYVLEILKDEIPSLPPSSRKFGGLEQKWVPLSLSPQKTGFVRVFEGSVPGTTPSNDAHTVDPEEVEGEEGEANGEAKGKGIESRDGPGVGNIAKIYGFGGRRV